MECLRMPESAARLPVLTSASGCTRAPGAAGLPAGPRGPRLVWLQSPWERVNRWPRGARQPPRERQSSGLLAFAFGCSTRKFGSGQSGPFT
eukprot:8899695-Lingulodinium_polyedra.AAC.1